jgi:ribonuclease VapC
MAEAVLDASALLAFLRSEPGADKVAAVLTRCCISAVNLAETITKMVEHGKPLDQVGYQIDRLRIPVIPFDATQARIVASLRQATRAAGAWSPAASTRHPPWKDSEAFATSSAT